MSSDSSSDPSSNAQLDDEIDLRELWRALMRGKWIIIGFTAVFSIVSVFYALSLPNMYKSTAVLAPAQSFSGGLSSLARQFGGLATFAGINVGSGGSNKSAEALEILKSWGFIEEFIREKNIAPEVFAVKGWNPETNELIYDIDIYDPQSKVWSREPLKGKHAEPSSWALYEKFSGYLSVSEGKVSGFTNLGIEYYSPEVAKVWVDALVKKINTKLQLRETEEAENNVAFLKQQIEQTPLANMQSIFYSLVEEQTKTLMLAQGSTEYVFKTVSEAREPEERSTPKRALICIFSAVLGAFLGCIISLVCGLKRQDVI